MPRSPDYSDMKRGESKVLPSVKVQSRSDEMKRGDSTVLPAAKLPSDGRMPEVPAKPPLMGASSVAIADRGNGPKAPLTPMQRTHLGKAFRE